jgi:hypothetical protein
MQEDAGSFLHVYLQHMLTKARFGAVSHACESIHVRVASVREIGVHSAGMDVPHGSCSVLACNTLKSVPVFT